MAAHVHDADGQRRHCRRIAQAAYDFTIRYLRGEMPGTPPVKRRMYPTKQLAVAQMKIMLEQTKSLWFQSISEARPNPGKDHRCFAPGGGGRASSTASGKCQRHRPAGDPHLRWPGDAALAAAGTALPRQPLRGADAAMDRRAGLDMIGKGALYEPGESDED